MINNNVVVEGGLSVLPDGTWGNQYLYQVQSSDPGTEFSVEYCIWVCKNVHFV